MKTGLVLVDIQNDYFPGGNMELVAMQPAAATAATVLGEFRDRKAPVYHIQHLSVRPGATFFIPDTEGAETHTSVAPAGGEPVIQKNFPNSFRDTALLETLRDDNTESLVICGAMSHMCIDATTRAAFDLGFSCIVVSDACATRDLQFEGRTIPARDVHAAFMAALSVPYASVVTARELAVGAES
ncbi:MAG: isochorismatase family protein [Gammaproteobacteria bacterium]|nr:isochorismatase family protein [Gammaproteobacteria bacterium]NIM72995.1 isochorismatase family protein [Gammaproteobacteria bacterium]NIN38611.1 isochorismatase family protein [Gammaproteobacteria bacterium]NIO24747.1 isochorismatase family protein [Gammaproteobacteria bacterium]NIO65350.1 isochorismatase family protein [Gammaproteobacteria bacterium]